MFAFIEGEVYAKYTDHLILNHNGLAFVLYYDPKAGGRFPAQGEQGRIWTYMHVREDALSLYAFPSLAEKQLFELLLTVSGFGPKIAGAVAAELSPSVFALAIVKADIKLLSSVKGVGRKSAERLVLELKDKLKASSLSLSAAAEAGAQVDAAASSLEQEAQEALLVLGYSSSEAARVVQKVLQQAPATNEVSSLLKLALREMVVKK